MKKAIGILALALAAGAAQAASVSVNGAIVTNAGANNVAAIGTAGSVNFSGSGQNSSVSGIVAWSNPSGNTFELRLTGFTFTGTGSTNQTITIDIVQDYALDPNAISGTASHQFNGTVTFSGANQLAQGSTVSTHTAGGAPTVINNAFNPLANLSSGAGTTGINRGTASLPVAVGAGIWRIATTYTFTINANGGEVSIFLPDSGVDNTLVALVPLPPAAFAGLGGLALVGVGAAIRRRNLARA